MRVGLDRWPDVVVDAVAFGAHLERLNVAVDADNPHAADLYLAFACANGDPKAIAAFEHELAQVIEASARRIYAAQEFVDEVVQLVRERLLVATTGKPRIAEFSGQGSLRAWVRISAMRVAMNLLRDRKRDAIVQDEVFFQLSGSPDDPERAKARARYGQACSQALRTAFGELTSRERNLLRMHHLHGLTIDELAPTFRVHRATVARWLAQARDHLLAKTRDGLRERLAVGDDEVDSILRALAGQIEISVSRLLAESTD